MPTLTLHDLPDDLHARLAELAEGHDRPVEDEIRNLLISLFDDDVWVAEAALSRARMKQLPTLEKDVVRDGLL